MTDKADTDAGFDPHRGQWRVRHGYDGERALFAPDRRVIVTGRRLADQPPGVLAFEAADGTRQVFELGEWSSAVHLPHQDNPDPHAKLMRAYLQGQATLADVRIPGRWITDNVDPAYWG